MINVTQGKIGLRRMTWTRTWRGRMTQGEGYLGRDQAAEYARWLAWGWGVGVSGQGTRGSDRGVGGWCPWAERLRD